MEGRPPPLEERRRLQEELSEFVESCYRTLGEVTASLGWSLEQLDPGEEEAAAEGEGEVVICPYDSNHHMPKSSLSKHMESCSLRKMGYTKEEEDEIYNPEFFYENVKVPSITLNKDAQFQIINQARTKVGKDGDCYSQRMYSSLPVEVPLNHKRAVCDLTQADRLALYDFVVEETKKKRSDSQTIENDSDLFVDLAAKVNQDTSRKSPKSYLEILAEVRDYKRRRQSYRAKNVHITKKSYTEVIRDVINVHMEELSNHWQDEQGRAEGDAENSRIVLVQLVLRSKYNMSPPEPFPTPPSTQVLVTGRTYVHSDTWVSVCPNSCALQPATFQHTLEIFRIPFFPCTDAERTAVVLALSRPGVVT
ncbi:U11/U12 small nuclear ribonucleoprotein 48 kDa protein [Octodon degus]|uniref:U11/U12 small nuclear ribonucleoprotein 48 kDa protein n=1 Tax=Octodon degus TaxID=10160 RepID=A0A6P3EPX1_OCTDE|nr:U11/U12 small nuclear ribonucleoprotein 48 kDa protein [Octodon degus]